MKNIPYITTKKNSSKKKEKNDWEKNKKMLVIKNYI